MSLPFSSFWSSILIFLFLFHKPFIMLFISILVVKEIIPLPLSCLLSSYKKSSPSLLILCLYFYCISAKNFESSVDFPKSLMRLCSHALSWALPTTLNSCFSRWLIIPSPSVNRWIPLWLRFLPLIHPYRTLRYGKQSQNPQCSYSQT